VKKRKSSVDLPSPGEPAPLCRGVYPACFVGGTPRSRNLGSAGRINAPAAKPQASRTEGQGDTETKQVRERCVGQLPSGTFDAEEISRSPGWREAVWVWTWPLEPLERIKGL